MSVRVLLAAVCLTTAAAVPSAQSDLDALMSRVLQRRDENWKKLQQYTLQEREILQITALAVFRILGFEREYLWFPREGFFIRSPLTADGVAIAEGARRAAEDRWLESSRNREMRAAGDAAGKGGPVEQPGAIPGDLVLTNAAEDVILQSFEPQFIKSANFLRFTFDQGQYALVGRERMLDRDVLELEYYPANLFRDDDADQGERASRDDDRRERAIERQMDKVSQVTLWVDPAEHQILRYEFRMVDMDFLPGRSIVRVGRTSATMQMAEPFPGVWLPASIEMRFRMSTAAGPMDARYRVRYEDYRLPTVSGRIR